MIARDDGGSLIPLPRSFYEGRVLDVAPALIGKLLVHRLPEGVVAGRIVECEAYRGPEDLAAFHENTLGRLLR